MGDGWETKRSRQKGHKDWAILKLLVMFHSHHRSATSVLDAMRARECIY